MDERQQSTSGARKPRLTIFIITLLLLQTVYLAQRYGATQSTSTLPIQVRLPWPPEVVWVSSRPLPLITPQDVLDNYSMPSADELDHSDVFLSNEWLPRNVSLLSTKRPTDIAFEKDLKKYRSASNIKIHFGILTCPMMVYSRLLPLLNTSMRHADGIDIFIRRTGYSHAVVKVIIEEARRFHPHPERIRVIELDGPNNEDLFKTHTKSNSWSNLEILRYWGQEVEEMGGVHTAHVGHTNASINNQWYSLVDDDGYAFIANAKLLIAAEQHILLENVTVDTSTGQQLGNQADVPLLPPLLLGSHVIAFYLRRHFVNGGPGLYFNHNALVSALPFVSPWGEEQLYRKRKKGSKGKQKPPSHMDLSIVKSEQVRFNTTGTYYRPLSTSAYGSTCARRYGKANGGDTRLGLCLTDGGPWDGKNGTIQPGIGALLLLHKSSYFDTPMRAIGEMKFNYQSTFPTGFHRLRERKWVYRLGRIDSMRDDECERNPSSCPLDQPMVTWGDIERSIVEGPTFYPSHFYPRKYINYSDIYFSLPQRMIRSMNKRKKRPLDADPW